MKSLIVLALAVAVQAQTFFPQDNPAVAAANAAHYAEHARAGAFAGAPIPDAYRSAYYAPVATPVVTPDGFIADTPEVAAAKAAHFAEHARAAAAATPVASAAAAPPVFTAPSPYAEYYRSYYNLYYPNGRSVYSGPVSVPVVLSDGFLADTPEVAHAKASHLYKLYQESSRE